MNNIMVMAISSLIIGFCLERGLLWSQPLPRDQAHPAVSGDFVHVKGGTFTMGSPESEPEREGNESPQHQVRLSSFYMGKYTVTQREYQAVMGTNPSAFKGDTLPVERISWYDAIAYCNKRSQQEGLTPAYKIDKNREDPHNQSSYDMVRWAVTWNPHAEGYRLPTEAEWEYACRAGTAAPFNTGTHITTDQSNYDGTYPYNNHAKGICRETTSAVGSFAPNSWGLYDMHGNVYEWCWDWYGDYSSRPQTNPAGLLSGSNRVVRGGGWNIYGKYLRSASRYRTNPMFPRSNVGFRVARSG